MTTDLATLVDAFPEGWSEVAYAGRRYGLTKTTRTRGRSLSVYAEQLGGTDVVSANVYRTEAGDVLKPCEMPAEVVLDFLAGASAVPAPTDALPRALTD